jgi:hypothetical protein
VTKGGQSLKQVMNAIEVASRMNPKTLEHVLNEADPNVAKNADPFKLRTAMKKWLVDKLTKEDKPVPPSLKNPKLAITEGQVKEYLDRRFPNREPMKEIESLFQENDDEFFQALMENLHMHGDEAVLDLHPILPTAEVSKPDLPKTKIASAIDRGFQRSTTTGVDGVLRDRVDDAKDSAKDVRDR